MAAAVTIVYTLLSYIYSTLCFICCCFEQSTIYWFHSLLCCWIGRQRIPTSPIAMSWCTYIHSTHTTPTQMRCNKYQNPLCCMPYNAEHAVQHTVIMSKWQRLTVFIVCLCCRKYGKYFWFGLKSIQWMQLPPPPPALWSSPPSPSQPQSVFFSGLWCYSLSTMKKSLARKPLKLSLQYYVEHFFLSLLISFV